jgi:hypothetical protein
MHLRQVTVCPQTATHTTHRQHHGRPAWKIVTCQRHRRLDGWSVPGNLHRLDADAPPVVCGTVHDYRPAEEIIVSHLHGWIGATGHWSDTPAPQGWHEQLRAAHSFLHYIRDEQKAQVTGRALQLSESGSMPALLALLANAETAAAQQHRA